MTGECSIILHNFATDLTGTLLCMACSCLMPSQARFTRGKLLPTFVTHRRLLLKLFISSLALRSSPHITSFLQRFLLMLRLVITARRWLILLSVLWIWLLISLLAV